ncbi:MAG: hypothetical protein ACKOPM_15690 [Novosphingobium sp.]
MGEARQAVVLIHGIGEQRPMSTLRGFVATVLSFFADQLGGKPAFYSKPDAYDETFELRRIIAQQPKRTDFYELYWAHLMPDAHWNRIASWFWLMMLRAPKNVPLRILPIWLLSWAAMFAAAVVILPQLVSWLAGVVDPVASRPSVPWIAGALVAALSAIVLSYVGDAAIYFGSSPRNIEARRRIRALGLNLLRQLNADPRYDRIIVVGHSLGSVVGYDVINLCWHRLLDEWRNGYLARVNAGQAPLNGTKQVMAAEAMAKGNPDDFDLARWEAQTDAVRAEIAANGYDWKIAHFISLGSPLTHADLLMAANRREFSERKEQREFATAPPYLENKGFTYYHRFRTANGKTKSIRVPHHAAAFSAMRWTNIYFGRPFRWGTDLVGGQVSNLFGQGVRDICVHSNIWMGLLSHIHYWRLPRGRQYNSAPQVLMEALKLDRGTAE